MQLERHELEALLWLLGRSEVFCKVLPEYPGAGIIWFRVSRKIRAILKATA